MLSCVAHANAKDIIRENEFGQTFSPNGGTFHLFEALCVLNEVMSRELSSSGI